MYVVVVGLGDLGRDVVQLLESEGHDVVAIDDDPERVAEVEEHNDVATLVAYGGSPKTMRRAQAERADLVVAVTGVDEVNLLAALAASQQGAKRVIARVTERQFGEDSGVTHGLLGVDIVINPQILVAQEIGKIARSHGALEVINLVEGSVTLVQVMVTEQSRILKRPISKLSLPSQTLIAAIVRPDGTLTIPGGNDFLYPGDRAYLIGVPHRLDEAESLFTRSSVAQRVCIVGGGVVGRNLADALVRDGGSPMVIERDRAVASVLAAERPKVTVLLGDGTDLRLLEEEVGAVDLFVAVTGEDEVNLMSSLLAKRAGAARTIALVHSRAYMTIYSQLGIDVVVSPRAVASDLILRYCRDGALRSLTVLEGGKAEVLEAIAPRGARIVGAALSRLPIPANALIGAVIQGDEVIIPDGGAEIRAGDRVIVLTTPDSRKGVARLFQKVVF